MNAKESLWSLKSLLLLGFLVFFSVWLRMPTIDRGMPFFYHEDEAHHFNRTVNMVKSGEWNPNYFHKPSLHFYLRIPVVVTSFFWTVGKGQIRSIKDVKTHDKFGLAGYSFTASHSGIVKWNRAFSVLLGIGLVVLSFLIARELLDSTFLAFLAALLTSVSPELVEHSAKIGVDMPMAFLCMLTVYRALRLESKRDLFTLAALGLCAGLTVSTKYNALPIAVVPLLLCVLHRVRSFRLYLVAAVSPLLGFLLGSPYILASFPLFLDQFAYEIWHYGVEGHVGHMGEPGVQQAMFFGNWFLEGASGFVATAFALIGLAAIWQRSTRMAVLFLAFPALFFLLMSSQKANFTRNLLVLIPFVSVLAAAGLAPLLRLFELFKAPRPHPIYNALVVFIPILQPLLDSVDRRVKFYDEPDSRRVVHSWILENQKPWEETAIEGRLQLPSFVATIGGRKHLAAKGLTRISTKDATPADFYQDGFDRVVTNRKLSGLNELKEFPGISKYQRIVQNPAVRVYEVGTPKVKEPAILDVATCKAEPEGYCWLTKRFTELELVEPDAKGNLTLTMEIMSPWPAQTLKLSVGKSSKTKRLKEVGDWTTVKFTIPADVLSSEKNVLAEITEIHSPATQDLRADDRRLGLALKNIALK